MAQIVSDLENNHTGRKLATMATTLGSLIEIFSTNYLLKFFYRESHVNPYIFVGHARTELGAPVEFPALCSFNEEYSNLVDCLTQRMILTKLLTNKNITLK